MSKISRYKTFEMERRKKRHRGWCCKICSSHKKSDDRSWKRIRTTQFLDEKRSLNRGDLVRFRPYKGAPELIYLGEIVDIITTKVRKIYKYSMGTTATTVIGGISVNYELKLFENRYEDGFFPSTTQYTREEQLEKIPDSEADLIRLSS